MRKGPVELREKEAESLPRRAEDARSLSRPDLSYGAENTWRDWAVVLRSYTTLIDEQLFNALGWAERRAGL